MRSGFLLLCYSLLLISVNSCSSTKPVATQTISQKYYDLDFAPEKVTKQSVNATEITVEPVDAKSLNREMFDASNRDGNYDKEINSMVENLNDRIRTASSKQKIYLQGKMNAFEYISKLEKDGRINGNIAILMKRKINDERSGNDGTEPECLADTDVFSEDSYNPYKINDHYFSVFRVTFENKGSEVEKISLKEFQVLSNQEQLYPLTSAYLESNLRYNKETIKNAYRMNMPDELVLTAGQKVTKYMAVPAINSGNDKLQVQFIRDKNVVNFDFAVKRNEVEKHYSLEQYQLEYRGEGNEYAYRTFFVISYKNNVSFALRDPKLTVSNNKKTVPASIYAIGINTGNSEIVYAAEENFLFSGVSDNKKKVEFHKVRK